MWVLPKNYQLSSAFAADMVESKEDLSLQGLNIEQSVMWRSKPSPFKTWCRRWKEDSYLQHLFTRILKPSQHKSFETKLTSSLEDILANRFHKQEKEQKTTQGICGNTSENIWKQLDLIELCSKTSKDTYRLDSPQSLATWKKMVTTQRGEYSQRVKLAHTTREKEYSSWPTPATRDYKGLSGKGRQQRKNNPLDTLPNAVMANWPTATVFDATGGGYPTEIVNGQYKSKHSKDPDSAWYGAKLADAVKVNWPTPSAHEARLGYQDRSDSTKKGTQESLLTVIVNKSGGRSVCTGHLNPDWVEKLMGVPNGWTALDGNSNDWQNNWSGDWEGNTPRTTDVKKDRVDRIRMLGNGVVPATAAKAWTVLSARLNKG